ncbi:MAG TPA: C40 family peptidase [Acidimicrobiales bacterium]|nr:C40 family peptidase [Acidimicrobiales bacterium]
MRRLAAIVALLGGFVSVVEACGGSASRPVSVHKAVSAPPAATQSAGPTSAARHTFIEERVGQGRQAWVAVPVATLWNQPGFTRPVDRLVVQAQPAVADWLSSMDTSSKLELDYTMATQALLDEPLTVVEISGDWADVLVQDQTGSVYTDGVEGWMPLSQITFDAPPATGAYATVSQPIAGAGDPSLSYGTRLPILSSTPGGYVVWTPYGKRFLPGNEARPAPPPITPQAVLGEAEKFLGLPYLWAGTSGYGFDCSGLTYAIYRQFGITLARDAGDQASEGRPVARDQLRPGDLMFFASGGQIHHVGIYAGNGLMLHAPQTGSVVQEIKIWSSPLASQYEGARRYFG